MKVFVAIVAVVAVAIAVHAKPLSDEQKDIYKGYKKECLEQTGADKEAVKQIKKGIFADDDDQKVKDFLLCFDKKAGFLDEAGDYQLDAIKSKVTDEHGAETADKLIAACTAAKSDTPAETSYQLKKCYFAHVKDVKA